MAKKQEDKSALQQLKLSLREKKADRLYIFHGEEVFLLHHYFGQLKKLLIDDLTESFNFHKLTAETFDIQNFADAVENLPMMADYTMVHVDEVDLFKLPESDRDKMAQILTDIPEYCCVVFTFETTPWKPDKRFKKLHDAIQANANVVEFPKQELRDLIAWVTRHFAARNKQISADLCSYLIDITGGTMTVLSGEIDKICSYSGSDQIKKADIDAVTEPVLDAVVFQMTDQLGKGQYFSSLECLQKLIKMQEEPLGILGNIGAHFRRISAAKVLLDNGKNASELMKLYGISEYAARKTMDAARRFSSEFCRKALQLLIETDYAMKTSYDDPARLLEKLVLNLAQEAKNG